MSKPLRLVAAPGRAEWQVHSVDGRGLVAASGDDLLYAGSQDAAFDEQFGSAAVGPGSGEARRVRPAAGVGSGPAAFDDFGEFREEVGGRERHEAVGGRPLCGVLDQAPVLQSVLRHERDDVGVQVRIDPAFVHLG